MIVANNGGLNENTASHVTKCCFHRNYIYTSIIRTKQIFGVLYIKYHSAIRSLYRHVVCKVKLTEIGASWERG